MTTQPAVYNGFTRPRGVGILDMSLPASLAFLADLLVTINIIGAVPGWAKLLLWAQLLVFLGACVVKNSDGVTLWTRASRKVRFNLFAGAGIAEYKPSFIGKKPPASVMTSTEAMEFKTSLEQVFTLIHYPISQQYAVVLRCRPNGGERLSTRDRNQRATNWGGFGTALSRIRGVAQYSVVVESAPRTQMETRRIMDDFLSDDPDTPQDAIEVTRERMNYGTENHVGNDSWVTVTFNAIEKGISKKASAANAEYIAGVLPGIIQRLSDSGAGRVRPATEVEVAEYQRAMIDPQARPLIENAHAEGVDTGIRWDNCGPMHLDPSHEYLVHDQAVSATFVLSEPPTDSVPDDILRDLLLPHPDIEIKRVALIKQVMETGQAKTFASRDLSNAQNRARISKGDPAQREMALAVRTTDEVNQGYALEDFTIVATVTVTDPEKLQRAILTMLSNLGPAAGCRLRLATEQQDTAFFYAGPFGLDLHQHSAAEVTQRRAMTVATR